MIKWEYLTVTADLNQSIYDADGRKRGLDPQSVSNMLAQHGAKGWELVSSFDLNANGTTSQITFIFKRHSAGAVAHNESSRIGFDLDGDGHPG
jgi:Domain of unknown function (DUF4177)